MSVEFFISQKYLQAGRKKSFISFISIISIAGLVIAIIALITVLSVMNGFHKELKNRVLNTISHAYISEYGDRLANWQSLQKDINKNPHVVNSSPYIEGYALIGNGAKFNGSSVRGVVPEMEQKISAVLNNIKYGELNLTDDNILIGYGLAYKLGAGIGTRLVLLTPQTYFANSATPQLKSFVVSAIFDAGVNEYDNNLVFINLSQAQDIYAMPGLVSGVRLQVDDLFKSDTITSEIITSIGKDRYYGIDWMAQKSNFIKALNLEKRMIAMILSIIIIVAIFNIVSMMMIVVNTKKSDIAILRTIGMTPRRIIKIFFYQGLTIGIIGILLGTVLGILLAVNIDNVASFVEYILGFKFFPKNVFYINNFPSEVQIMDIVNITVGALFLVIISIIYPAMRATKVNIAKVLSYE